MHICTAIKYQRTIQCNAIKCNTIVKSSISVQCSAAQSQLSSCRLAVQIRDRPIRGRNLNGFIINHTLRRWYVARTTTATTKSNLVFSTKSNLVFSINLVFFTKPKLVFSINLVFLTKSNLVFCTTNTWWLPRTPSQTAFFTFFPCIFNLSRAILGAVWINLILPQNISLCIQIICSTRTPSDQISGKVSKIWSSSSCIHWYVSWKMNRISKLESLAQGILSSLKYCML